MDYTLELIVVPSATSTAPRRSTSTSWASNCSSTRRWAPTSASCSSSLPAPPRRSRSGPGSARCPGLAARPAPIVSDIEAARDELVSRGTEVGDIFHFGEAGQTPGIDPERRPYATFMPLEDPDGNTWLVQEVKRDWKVTTVKIDEVAA